MSEKNQIFTEQGFRFLQDHLPFFVLTINGNQPAGRPFGAIMQQENKLYISTSCQKDVYKQLKASPQIQLLAFAYGSRNWARISGLARETDDLKIKEVMLEKCPVLKKHYSDALDPCFNVFEITVTNQEFF